MLRLDCPLGQERKIQLTPPPYDPESLEELVQGSKPTGVGPRDRCGAGGGVTRERVRCMKQ